MHPILNVLQHRNRDRRSNTTQTMSTASLVVSTAFIAACSAAGCFGRRLTDRLIKPGLVRELFNEAIAAAELCACCFELIISKYLLSHFGFVLKYCWIPILIIRKHTKMFEFVFTIKIKY